MTEIYLYAKKTGSYYNTQSKKQRVGYKINLKKAYLLLFTCSRLKLKLKIMNLIKTNL